MMIATKESPRSDSTFSRLLDGAERSIFRHGYKGASIRRITQEAGTNIASINYHFGSKKELFAALIQRRLNTVARQRAESLKSIEGRAGYSIDDIVRAYFGALLQIRQSVGQEVLLVIWTLLVGDQDVSQPSDCSVDDSSIDVRRHYAQTIATLTPAVPVAELEWRLDMLERFALCVMAGPDTFWTSESTGLPDTAAIPARDALNEGLMSIIRASIQAPVVTRQDKRETSDKSSSPGE